MKITFIYVRNENLTYLVWCFLSEWLHPLPMNIFPIQGLTEDRCAYGRTQGVLLPVWNTKECPVSVFHINADDMILSMLMIWFFSKNHIMKAKESVWQKISDLNYPFAFSHVPFPKQAVSPLFSPPTRIDANKIMGLPATHESLHLQIWYHSFQ